MNHEEEHETSTDVPVWLGHVCWCGQRMCVGVVRVCVLVWLGYVCWRGQGVCVGGRVNTDKSGQCNVSIRTPRINSDPVNMAPTPEAVIYCF